MQKRKAFACTLLALAMLVILLFPAGAAGNKDRVYQMLTTRGLNTAAACGIMANMEIESNFKPTATSPGGSYGLCQWTGSRKTDLNNYCKKNGYEVSSVDGQVAFLLYELQTSYKSVYKMLQSTACTADGAYNAAYRFCYDFERPASKSSRSAERANCAKNSYWPQYKQYASLNGIVKGPDAKWAMYKNGAVQTGYSGVAKNQYGWWRVVKGFVDFKANGIYKNDYGRWKCTNGKVTFQETGIFSNDYGTWYVENSKVDFSKTDVVEFDGTVYNVEGGKATVAPPGTTVAQSTTSGSPTAEEK